MWAMFGSTAVEGRANISTETHKQLKELIWDSAENNEKELTENIEAALLSSS
jgi:hypothetical protein